MFEAQIEDESAPVSILAGTLESLPIETYSVLPITPSFDVLLGKIDSKTMYIL